MLSTALRAVVLFTLLLGLAYPLLITGIAQVAFPGKADGSRIERSGELVGSRLIGQDFRGRARYFQSRPSATEWAANATFFNNLGPNSRELADLLEANAAAYAEREGIPRDRVPADAAQTSGSGVDPHVSEANAALQARRVARTRGLELDRVMALIDEHTDGRALGLLGDPGVRVLELNLALDAEAR